MKMVWLPTNVTGWLTGGVKLPAHAHLPEPDSGREESPANVCECRGMSPQRTFLRLRLAGGGFDLTRLMVQLMSRNLVRVGRTFLAPISSSVYAASITQQQDKEALQDPTGQRVEQVPPGCAGAVQITDLKIILLATTTTWPWKSWDELALIPSAVTVERVWWSLIKKKQGEETAAMSSASICHPY